MDISTREYHNKKRNENGGKKDIGGKVEWKSISSNVVVKGK